MTVKARIYRLFDSLEYKKIKEVDFARIDEENQFKTIGKLQKYLLIYKEMYRRHSNDITFDIETEIHSGTLYVTKISRDKKTM